MKKKSGRRNVPWMLIIFLVCLSLAAGYFFGANRAKMSAKPQQVPGSEPLAKQESPEADAEIPMMREKIPAERGDSDQCRKLQEELKDFFSYLNGKQYVQEIEKDLDTYEWFKRIIAKLSVSPPIPAGERLDQTAMTNHIFFFFRNLEPKELRLLRDVVVNESSTLEPNMDLFFRWISLDGKCPEGMGMRPSPELLYSYAGFFLNTIGGRAYLFRSPPAVRLLITYYCLRIISDADRRGKNSYGIDIAPYIRTLSSEMAQHTDFLYQKEYQKRLIELEGLYRRK